MRQLQAEEGLANGAYQLQYAEKLEYDYKNGRITKDAMNAAKARLKDVASEADPHCVRGLVPIIKNCYASKANYQLRICDDFGARYSRGLTAM